jgi:type III pantothenate kinase
MQSVFDAEFLAHLGLIPRIDRASGVVIGKDNIESNRVTLGPQFRDADRKCLFDVACQGASVDQGGCVCGGHGGKDTHPTTIPGMADLQLIAIDVGNSCTRVAAIQDTSISDPISLGNGDLGAVTQAVLGQRESLPEASPRPIVVASVNDGFADQLASALKDQLSEEVYRVGVDLPIPMQCELAPETITGVDRLLNAAAAFDVLKQACIVVDAGTAVTVDFVDGDGIFHGGAIAPGGQMQLRSLHEYTEALPDLEFVAPEIDAFGRSTSQAMLKGVHFGIQGMVRILAEHYADHYGAYPTIVATGGDADTLFRGDELIDRIVPDLTLQGIAVAARHAMATAGGDETED